MELEQAEPGPHSTPFITTNAGLQIPETTVEYNVRAYLQAGAWLCCAVL